jgi:tRNA(fMet)-specific endonuclease VapC
MMRYILDTNMCIYVIKKKTPRVLERFKAFQISDIGISTITLSELEYGVAKSTRKEQNRGALIEFLAPLEILPFDEKASHHYGEIRAFLEREGISIGSMDLLIASHARSLMLPLVTNDTRAFKRIPGLQTENWV